MARKLPPPKHLHRKISASVDGGLAEVLAWADPGARAPIGALAVILLSMQTPNGGVLHQLGPVVYWKVAPTNLKVSTVQPQD